MVVLGLIQLRLGIGVGLRGRWVWLGLWAILSAIAAYPIAWAEVGSDGVRMPVGIPLAKLPALDRSQFQIGAAIFAADWIAAPNVSEGADGLGPLYNATACATCHPVGGSQSGDAGQQAQSDARGESTIIARVVRLVGRGGRSTGDRTYGRQLQDRAVSGVAREGRVTVNWRAERVMLGDGQSIELRRPDIAVEDLAFGPLAVGTRLSVRRPPPLSGLGLIAAIDDADIAAGADPDDRNGDGIAGRVSWTVDPVSGQRVLARFGWAASAATLAGQTADALNLDMGLSSPLRADAAGDCTAAQAACRSAPDGRSAAKGGHEVSAEEIALIVAFLEGLAPPLAGAKAQDVEGASGEVDDGARVFAQLGCRACHRPSFVTQDLPDAPHLSRKTAALYSDLLLHDLGGDLAEGAQERVDQSVPSDLRLWRTAPLWGLGARLDDIAVGRIDGLLHDGRARTIEEAILWHGGEGTRAREAYRSLSETERRALVAYLATF